MEDQRMMGQPRDGVVRKLGKKDEITRVDRKGESVEGGTGNQKQARIAKIT